MAPPKKKRKTTESTTDIHISRPRTPRSAKSVYQRRPATVNTTDLNLPLLAEDNTGTTPNHNVNINYTRLAEEILRLQNSGNINPMGGIQPASSSRNIHANSLAPSTSSFLASDTELSSEQLQSQDNNSSTTVPQPIPDNIQPTRNSTSAMSVNNNTPYTDNSQIQNVHNLIDNILSTESPATSLTGRELCHGPIVDLSGGIPLGAHISQRVKEKIWNNEFMNLADLLPKLDFEDPWSVTLGPSLITMSKQSSKSRGPLSFYEWNEAFHIYMAIYIERFPSEAPNMLKYMSIVKDAYEMRGTLAFRTYDQSFRLLRARNNLPWQKPIDELFTKSVFPKRHYAQTFPNNSPNKYIPPTLNRRSQPFLTNRDRDGTCHVWNTYEQCNRTNCPFKHVCKFCRGPHPKVRCNRQPNATQGPPAAKTHTLQPSSQPNKK